MSMITLEQAKTLYDAEDFDRAFVAYKILAADGDPIAQHTLAKMYSNGLGTDVDLTESVAWLTRAADQGLVNSQFNLAEMFHGGEGVERSYDKAYYWHRKAQRQGDTESAEVLSELDESAQPDKDDSFSLCIVLNGQECTDCSEVRNAACDGMSEDQQAAAVQALRGDWEDLFGRAQHTVYKYFTKTIDFDDCAAKVNMAFLFDELRPSEFYGFLADIYGLRRKLKI